MLKTDKQLLIEAQNGGKDLKQVLLEVLGRHRGEKHLLMRVGLELNVSHQTAANWCQALEIDINDYR